MSLHQVAIAAELSGARSYWSIYTRHLNHISEMLENGTLASPFVHVVGSLSVKTAQQAHTLLQEGHVKGKLVMVME